MRGGRFFRARIRSDANAIPDLPVERSFHFLRVVAERLEPRDHLVRAALVHHGFYLDVVRLRARRKSAGRYGGRRGFLGTIVGLFVRRRISRRRYDRRSDASDGSR